MKEQFLRHRLLLPLLFLIGLNPIIHSQQNYIYTERADSLFANLDKSLITTGILYDRAFPLSRFDLYNSATDTVDYEYISQAYYELYQAAYNRYVLLEPGMLNEMTAYENLRNRVPIMVLDYLYNKMDTMAFQDGLFDFQNDMFYDVPGRPRNPYYTQHLQIAGPLLEEVKSNTLQFVLLPHLISRNTGQNVQQVQLNFGFGQYSLNGPLDSVTINFPASGTHYFTTTVTLANSSSFTSKCQLTIGGYSVGARGQGIEAVYDPCRTELMESAYPFQGYDEQQPFKGQFEVNYYYRLTSPCNGSNVNLQKPVILIDGFDPTDKRTAAKLYEEFLFYYDDVNFNPKKYVDIVDEMRQLGYDVILINIPTYFHTYGGQIIPLPANANDPPAGYNYSMGKIIRGGGDYVERNGLTLATLIEEINIQLANQNSTEKLVIIGPSMGGQISRYALRWMETNNKNHNCRLWVSFDSNHEGAVLPIGEQFIIRDMAGLSNEVRKALDRQINIVHAKQSLVDHHLFHVNGQQNAGGAPDFHQRYYSMMDNLGWPQQCRKIAMISGAENGAALPIPGAGQLAMKLTVKFKTWARLLLITGCGYICSRISPELAPLCALYCAIQSKKLIEASMFTAPGPGQYGKVSRLKIPLILKDKSFYGIGSSLTRSQSIETVQSGFYWGYKELTTKKDNGFIGKLTKTEVEIPAGYHSHQPTGNTLAYGKGVNGSLYNFKWDDDVSQYDLVCLGYIPFDYYYGPKTFSLKHDSLFYSQARNLINEINGIISPPFIPLPPSIITQYNNNDCNSATIVINNSNIVSCYDWETTGGLLLNGTSTSLQCYGPSVTVSGSQGMGGTIKARTRMGSCVSGYNEICFEPCQAWNANFRWIWSAPRTGEPLQAQVDELPGAIYYQWFVNGTLIETTPTGFLSTYNWPCVYEGEGLTVLAVTDCGRSELISGGNYSPICYNRHVSGIKVFPNPSSGIVMVSLEKGNSKIETQRSIYEIRIIDKMGIIKYQHQYMKGTPSVIVDISNLSLDVYTVLAFDGEKWRTAKLVKK